MELVGTYDAGYETPFALTAPAGILYTFKQPTQPPAGRVITP